MKRRAEHAPATKHATGKVHYQEHSALFVAGSRSSQASSVQCASFDFHGRVLQQGSRRLRAACIEQQCHWLHRLTTREGHHKREAAVALPCKATSSMKLAGMLMALATGNGADQAV